MNDCVPIYLKLLPEKIVELKLILESYEGIGELRTLDNRKGEVVILAVKDTEQIARELVADIKEQIGVREIPKPDDLSGDWLLGES